MSQPTTANPAIAKDTAPAAEKDVAMPRGAVAGATPPATPASPAAAPASTGTPLPGAQVAPQAATTPEPSADAVVVPTKGAPADPAATIESLDAQLAELTEELLDVKAASPAPAAEITAAPEVAAAPIS